MCCVLVSVVRLNGAILIDIYVWLLDTIISDKHIEQIKQQVDNNVFQQVLENRLKKKGHEQHHIDKVLKAIPAENMLNSELPTVKHTHVILFKAIQPDLRYHEENTQKLLKYSYTLKNNNVDQVTRQYEIIPIDCHHGNILDQESTIVQALLKYIN